MKGIKNEFFIETFLSNVPKTRMLKLINYNKHLQSIMEITIADYEKIFKQIKIELKLVENLNENATFINRIEDKSLYHIYFDDSKKEIDRDYIIKGDKISKITILIEAVVTSLKNLFHKCKCLKEIDFIKFNRRDILDMSGMFNDCENVTKLNISKLKTDNTTDMSNMFRYCNKLEELDVSNFVTDNVTNMFQMFSLCHQLKRLNLSNFRTKNVIDMSSMFLECSKLEELNISNFNIDKVKYINSMFSYCEKLENLDITSFNFNEDLLYKNNRIFAGCSEKLKQSIRNQKPEIGPEEFEI